MSAIFPNGVPYDAPAIQAFASMKKEEDNRHSFISPSSSNSFNQYSSGTSGSYNLGSFGSPGSFNLGSTSSSLGSGVFPMIGPSGVDFLSCELEDVHLDITAVETTAPPSTTFVKESASQANTPSDQPPNVAEILPLVSILPSISTESSPVAVKDDPSSPPALTLSSSSTASSFSPFTAFASLPRTSCTPLNNSSSIYPPELHFPLAAADDDASPLRMFASIDTLSSASSSSLASAKQTCSGIRRYLATSCFLDRDCYGICNRRCPEWFPSPAEFDRLAQRIKEARVVKVVLYEQGKLMLRLPKALDLLVHSRVNSGPDLAKGTDSRGSVFRWYTEYKPSTGPLLGFGNVFIKDSNEVDRTIKLDPRFHSPYLERLSKANPELFFQMLNNFFRDLLSCVDVNEGQIGTGRVVFPVDFNALARKDSHFHDSEKTI